MDKINRFISVPLYYQIQEILEEKILSGSWEEGYRLPTEKELSKHFDVSTITVKRAIHELVNKGLIYRVKAKGTFVAKSLKEENIFNLVTFGSEEKPTGISEHKILNHSIEEADPSARRKLSLKDGDLVLKLDRLKIEGKQTIAIERTFIVQHLLPEFSMKKSEVDTIYNVIRDDSKVKLAKAKIYLSTTSATEDESKLLQVRNGTPLIIIERITFLDTQEAVEYSKFIMRQDTANYFFEVDL